MCACARTALLFLLLLSSSLSDAPPRARGARAEVYKKGGLGKCTRGFGFRVGNFFLFCLSLFRVYRFFCFEHPFFGSKKLQKRKARAHKHNTNTHNTRARTFISRKKKQVVHSALVVEYTRERTKRNNNTNNNKERCQRARRYKPQRWMWTRKRGRKM